MGKEWDLVLVSEIQNGWWDGWIGNTSINCILALLLLTEPNELLDD